MTTFLDADEIRAATFIRHVEIHETLGSTNDRALELAREAGIELPALVVTRKQTAGRGRGQNQWLSWDGALTFSILLDPAVFGIGTESWPQLSLATAVAVCDTLANELNRQSGRLAIKWPNDVLLDRRKICGILIESPGIAARQRVIIGIGINVSNSWHGAPPEVAQTGIALCEASGRQHTLQSIMITALDAIASEVRQLASGNSNYSRWPVIYPEAEK